MLRDLFDTFVGLWLVMWVQIKVICGKTENMIRKAAENLGMPQQKPFYIMLKFHIA